MALLELPSTESDIGKNGEKKDPIAILLTLIFTLDDNILTFGDSI